MFRLQIRPLHISLIANGPRVLVHRQPVSWDGATQGTIIRVQVTFQVVQAPYVHMRAFLQPGACSTSHATPATNQNLPAIRQPGALSPPTPTLAIDATALLRVPHKASLTPIAPNARALAGGCRVCVATRPMRGTVLISGLQLTRVQGLEGGMTR